MDGTFAAAYSRLAYAIILSMIFFDADNDTARMDEALAVARRGIELDDQDANGYFTLGRVHLARQEYGDAIEVLEYALELTLALQSPIAGWGIHWHMRGALTRQSSSSISPSASALTTLSAAHSTHTDRSRTCFRANLNPELIV